MQCCCKSISSIQLRPPHAQAMPGKDSVPIQYKVHLTQCSQISTSNLKISKSRFTIIPISIPRFPIPFINVKNRMMRALWSYLLIKCLETTAILLVPLWVLRMLRQQCGNDVLGNLVPRAFQLLTVRSQKALGTRLGYYHKHNFRDSPLRRLLLSVWRDVTKKSWSKLLQQDHKVSFVQRGYRRRRKRSLCYFHFTIRASHAPFFLSSQSFHQNEVSSLFRNLLRSFSNAIFQYMKQQQSCD